MIKSGNSLDELRDLLLTLDETTVLEGNLLTRRQELEIHAVRQDGCLLWNASLTPTSDVQGGGQRLTGKGYEKLVAAIDAMNTEREVDVSLVVLALAGLEKARTWDSKLVSNWILVAPSDPYLMEEGKPKFRTLQLELTDEEYAICAESNLAFYDEIDDILYPIRECAFDSIGRMMDCAASFKYRTPFPLGSALLLAERLAKLNSIRFLYRNRTEKVCPLIGIVGNNFDLYGQLCFVDEALDIIQGQYICHIDRWTVTDEKTVVTVLADMLDPELGIEFDIQTGDIMGTSMSITAYARIGKGRLMLRKNSAYHRKSFAGVSSLFEGVFESIYSFQDSYYQNKNLYCSFSSEDAKPIKSILGATRFSKVQLPADGTYRVGELMRVLVNATFCYLAEKQTTDLTKAYSAFYNQIVGEPVIQPMPAKLKKARTNKEVV